MSLPQKKHRVLIVDDEQMVAQATQIILTRHGYEAKVVHNGPAALKLLEGEQFDVVLTDLYMPQLKGDELADEIKRRNPRQRVVLTSGLDAQIERNAQLTRQPDLVVTKPYRLSSLIAALRTVVL